MNSVDWWTCMHILWSYVRSVIWLKMNRVSTWGHWSSLMGWGRDSVCHVAKWKFTLPHDQMNTCTVWQCPHSTFCANWVIIAERFLNPGVILPIRVDQKKKFDLPQYKVSLCIFPWFCELYFFIYLACLWPAFSRHRALALSSVSSSDVHGQQNILFTTTASN